MKKDAKALDEQHGLPLHHVEALREMGYPSWTVPTAYGGQGMPLPTWLAAQERLARANPAVALGMGWHGGIVYDLALKQLWPETAMAHVCQRIVRDGALINRAAMEVGGGSPSRGGKPRTTAQRLPEGGYRITGRKTFTTFAPMLEWFIVTASIEGTEEVAEFLVPHHAERVLVEWTWDMIGMRGTASHDIVLEGAMVSEEAKLYTYSQEDYRKPNPYLLHIPACYLGIGGAAQEEAIKFALSYAPPSLNGSVIHAPHVQQLLGEIELELTVARHLLYRVAEEWEANGLDMPSSKFADIAAVKTHVVQAALSTVDKAMRIVGAHGLRMDHPLQMMYRDVRFGLHNPPMENTAISMLAQRSIEYVQHGNSQSVD
ncbi:acyl-CoA/acyl-ACP dehydrogenase [Paenibacillus sp. 481]|nr:acyl-CoA/acyl-ACP dehydrogenase [Paenibacillus sp. 481]